MSARSSSARVPDPVSYTHLDVYKRQEEKGEDATSLMDHKVDEDKLEHSDVIIDVDHLTKEFKLPRRREMFKAVDDVSFKIRRGTTLAIVGESGSGKSTVANMVLRLLEPTSGKVLYNGQDIQEFKGKSLLDFRRHVQPVFQNPYGCLLYTSRCV